MFKIETKTDAQLSKKERTEILNLLNASFDNIFPNRIFFKQIPHKRILVKKNDTIVGQVGIDYRAMNLGGRLIDVVGIIDLCVAEEYQGKGIGSKLLQTVENQFKERADFILLFADEHKVYLNNGFKLANNKVTWLGIDGGKTIGILSKNMGDCLMYKSIKKGVEWTEDDLDMMGYLY